jgi:hypothetical protein
MPTAQLPLLFQHTALRDPSVSLETELDAQIGQGDLWPQEKTQKMQVTSRDKIVSFTATTQRSVVLLDHFPENVQGFGRYGVQA